MTCTSSDVHARCRGSTRWERLRWSTPIGVAWDRAAKPRSGRPGAHELGLRALLLFSNIIIIKIIYNIIIIITIYNIIFIIKLLLLFVLLLLLLQHIIINNNKLLVLLIFLILLI